MQRSRSLIVDNDFGCAWASMRLGYVPAGGSTTRVRGLYINVAVSNHVNTFLKAAEGASPMTAAFNMLLCRRAEVNPGMRSFVLYRIL